jgi:hypothetical protein
MRVGEHVLAWPSTLHTHMSLLQRFATVILPKAATMAICVVQRRRRKLNNILVRSVG